MTTTEHPLDELRLVSAREAADALGYSVAQLDRIVAAGAIKPIRLVAGGHRRFRISDIRQLVEAGNEEA